MNQKEVMLLGGNLPESCHYLYLDHHHDDGDVGTEDEDGPEQENRKTQGSPHQQAATS
jgi:hypothetical protein